jgi:hypothetical protein
MVTAVRLVVFPAGLDPHSAAKVLCHAYAAMVPIAPLPGPSLPLTPFSQAAPTYYGPTPEANSPWLSLALYAAARSGPVSLVFVAGQRVWRLPHQLEGCTHALLWAWKVGDASGAAAEPQPLLVEGGNHQGHSGAAPEGGLGGPGGWGEGSFTGSWPLGA